MNLQRNNSSEEDEGAIDRDAAARMRFLVAAPSVSVVRRALHRAPGGVRVVGRFDRETIECEHAMTARSFARHWPVVRSRLEKAGLRVVARPPGDSRGEA